MGKYSDYDTDTDTIEEEDELFEEDELLEDSEHEELDKKQSDLLSSSAFDPHTIEDTPGKEAARLLFSKEEENKRLQEDPLTFLNGQSPDLPEPVKEVRQKAPVSRASASAKRSIPKKTVTSVSPGSIENIDYLEIYSPTSRKQQQSSDDLSMHVPIREKQRRRLRLLIYILLLLILLLTLGYKLFRAIVIGILKGKCAHCGQIIRNVPSGLAVPKDPSSGKTRMLIDIIWIVF
jgi:hypothetical protein